MQIIRYGDYPPLPSLGLSALDSDRAVAQVNLIPIQCQDFGHPQTHANNPMARIGCVSSSELVSNFEASETLKTLISESLTSGRSMP